MGKAGGAPGTRGQTAGCSERQRWPASGAPRGVPDNKSSGAAASCSQRTAAARAADGEGSRDHVTRAHTPPSLRPSAGRCSDSAPSPRLVSPPLLLSFSSASPFLHPPRPPTPHFPSPSQVEQSEPSVPLFTTHPAWLQGKCSKTINYPRIIRDGEIQAPIKSVPSPSGPHIPLWSLLSGLQGILGCVCFPVVSTLRLPPDPPRLASKGPQESCTMLARLGPAQAAAVMLRFP